MISGWDSSISTMLRYAPLQAQCNAVWPCKTPNRKRARESMHDGRRQNSGWRSKPIRRSPFGPDEGRWRVPREACTSLHLPGISKFVGMHGSEHRRGDASWRRALATHTGPTRACGLRSVYAQCELHMLPYSCFACALRGRGCRNTVPCARQAYGVEWRVFAGRMDGGDSQPRLLHSLTLKGFNLLTSAPLSTSICAILWRPALHE